MYFTGSVANAGMTDATQGGSGSTDIIATEIQSGSGMSTTRITFTLSASAQTGDILVLFVSARNNTGSFTAPAGWTENENVVSTTGSVLESSIFTYTVTGSDTPGTTTYNIDHSQGFVVLLGGLLTIRGLTIGNTNSNFDTTFNTTHGAPGVTTTGANALVLTSYTCVSSGSYTPRTGQTELFDHNLVGVTQGAMSQTFASAGATGNMPSTFSSNNFNTGLTISMET